MQIYLLAHTLAWAFIRSGHLFARIGRNITCGDILSAQARLASTHNINQFRKHDDTSLWLQIDISDGSHGEAFYNLS